ncbi:MAG: acyl carrier protein [Xanthomonadaceae bacterium]|nr:acyl carrier protein [Xanthomonadaceae bacterium]
MNTQIDTVKLFTDYIYKVEKSKQFPTITRDAKISSLGIDSLGMMEIIGCFEDDLGIVIPDDKLATIQTVGDIEKVIMGQMASKLSN